MVDEIIAIWRSPSGDRSVYLYRNEQPNPHKPGDTIVTFTYQCFTDGAPSGQGPIQNANRDNARAISLTKTELKNFLDGGNTQQLTRIV